MILSKVVNKMLPMIADKMKLTFSMTWSEHYVIRGL